MRTKDTPLEKETRLYRGRLKTKALVHELAQRVNASSPDIFALWFDQKMRDKGLDRRANTAESNRWNVSFKGRAALQAEQLELLQELFTDASDFHQKGPSLLWAALWGEIDSLWPLCKTRIDIDAHYKDESAWEKDYGVYTRLLVPCPLEQCSKEREATQFHFNHCASETDQCRPQPQPVARSCRALQCLQYLEFGELNLITNSMMARQVNDRFPHIQIGLI